MFGTCTCNEYYYSCQLGVTSFVVIHDFTDGFIIDSHFRVPAAVDRSCDWLILCAILVASTEVYARSSLHFCCTYLTKDLPGCNSCCF